MLNNGVLFDEPPLQSHYYFTSESGTASFRPKLDVCYLIGAALGSQDNPASSCQAILEANPDAVDGLYWLQPSAGADADAVQTYCDMTGEGDEEDFMLILEGDGTSAAEAMGEVVDAKRLLERGSRAAGHAAQMR